MSRAFFEFLHENVAADTHADIIWKMRARAEAARNAESVAAFERAAVWFPEFAERAVRNRSAEPKQTVIRLPLRRDA